MTDEDDEDTGGDGRNTGEVIGALSCCKASDPSRRRASAILPASSMGNPGDPEPLRRAALICLVFSLPLGRTMELVLVLVVVLEGLESSSPTPTSSNLPVQPTLSTCVNVKMKLVCVRDALPKLASSAPNQTRRIVQCSKISVQRCEPATYGCDEVVMGLFPLTCGWKTTLVTRKKIWDHQPLVRLAASGSRALRWAHYLSKGRQLAVDMALESFLMI